METINKTITVLAVVDVVAILANDSLEGNLYLFDNNRDNDSEREGTEHLKTKIKFEGEESTVNLMWTLMPLESEAFAYISDIVSDDPAFEVHCETYPGSDIIYWRGTVKDTFQQLTYRLSIKVGDREKEYSCELEMERTF